MIRCWDCRAVTLAFACGNTLTGHLSDRSFTFCLSWPTILMTLQRKCCNRTWNASDVPMLDVKNLRIPSQVPVFIAISDSVELLKSCHWMWRHVSKLLWDYVCGAPFLSLFLQKDICSLLRQMLLGQGFHVFVDLETLTRTANKPLTRISEKGWRIIKAILNKLATNSWNSEGLKLLDSLVMALSLPVFHVCDQEWMWLAQVLDLLRFQRAVSGFLFQVPFGHFL